MEKLTGLVEKDMLGKKVLSFSPELKDQGFSRLLERGVVGETVISPDFRYHFSQTGRSGWLSGTCTPRHDNGGNITGVIVVLRDINERKQAEEDIRSQIERAEALLHVAARLNVQLDLDALLRAICEEATSMLHAPAAWISLYKPEQESLCYAGDYGMPPEFEEGYKSAGRALYRMPPDQMQRIIVTPDVQTLTGIPNWELYRALDIRTIAAGSIIRDGHFIGALSVISFVEERTFTEDDQALLRGLSNQAAQAIENARLFKDKQRHLNLQRTLHQIDLTITSETRLNASLKIILKLVVGQLNVDAAMVLLVDAQSGALDDIASYGLQDNLPKFHLEKGESYGNRMLLDRKTVYIPDLSQAVDWKSPSLSNLDKVVCYYGAPLIVQDQVIGVLDVFKASPFGLDLAWVETFEALTTQIAIAIESVTLLHDLKQSNTDLSQAYDTTLEGWSHAMDLRDKETEGHTQRVTRMSVQLAQAMSLGEVELQQIRRGALLHDMGKMGIPDAILLKPEPLTDEEWVIMHKHPVYAYEMISPIAYLQPALDIPYCHHEKWDGSGYPRGLKGEEIPMAARIFAIADVWDALTSDRPYRKAWPVEKAYQYVLEQAGSHFDPQVMAVFEKMMDASIHKGDAWFWGQAALPAPYREA